MSAHSQLRFHTLLRELSAEYDLLFDSVVKERSLLPPHPTPAKSRSLLGDSDDEEVTSLPKSGAISEEDLEEEPIRPLPGSLPQVPSTSSCNPKVVSLRSGSFSTVDMPLICSPLTVTSASKTFSAFEDPWKVRESVRRMSADATSGSDDAPVRKLSKMFSNTLKPASFREDGLLPRVAKSKGFEIFTIAVVVLNGIWIAIDADYNPADFILDADLIFIIVENLFCLVFTVEVLIRFFAFNRKSAAFHDFWFMFDTSLVLMTIFETWVMTIVIVAADQKHGIPINASILRLLRLVRLSRLSRIIRVVPELSFMVKGVLEATRSVACTMGLLFGILYVFGIVLRRLSNDTTMGETYFSSVLHAIFTLFAQATLLDGVATLMLEVNREDTLCAVIVLFVVMAGALTLMNMLVGVLCEVMNTVSHSEQERMAMNFVSEQIRVALVELDTNLDEHISKEEFQHILLNPKASQALRDIGVDVVAFVDFADYFFQSDKHGEEFEQKLSFQQFMEIIMQVRGINSATVRDIIELRKFIHKETTSRNAMLRRLQENQKTLANNQTKLEKCIMRKRKGNGSFGAPP